MLKGFVVTWLLGYHKALLTPTDPQQPFGCLKYQKLYGAAGRKIMVDTLNEDNARRFIELSVDSHGNLDLKHPKPITVGPGILRFADQIVEERHIKETPAGLF